jgi:dTDP-4-dehydrorhamnose reductase
MKYAVLGSRGQLGRDLCPRLAGEVIPLERAQVDLLNGDAMRAALQALRPDVVVNCAAYNFVDRAESEPAAAFAVNVWGVRDLALICRDLDVVLVQISSDYVFGLDSARQVPYAETDVPGPVSVYGTSKLSGEYLVQAICPRHFVIRTCGLYGVWGSGGKGGNFVETMLRKGKEGKPLSVVADQVCTPSYTVDVAQACAALAQTERFGLYHATNAGSCSWYEFAKAIFELADMQVDLATTTSSAYGAPARRPNYSVLATDKYRRLGAVPFRPWREALAAYLSERGRQAP